MCLVVDKRRREGEGIRWFSWQLDWCCMGRLHGRGIYKRGKAKRVPSSLVGWRLAMKKRINKVIRPYMVL
jgi:hypothetical protein